MFISKVDLHNLVSMLLLLIQYHDRTRIAQLKYEYHNNCYTCTDNNNSSYYKKA